MASKEFNDLLEKKLNIETNDFIRCVLSNNKRLPKTFQILKNNIVSWKKLVKSYQNEEIDVNIKFNKKMMKSLNINSDNQV